MKRLVLPLLLLAPLAACVTTGKYQAEQSAAAAQKRRADDLDAQLAALKSSSTAVEQDLSARLKAEADTLASAQISNKDLQQTLEANTSELTKKAAAMIKDRDTFAQKVNEQAATIEDLQRKAADADAGRAAAEAAKAEELAKAKKSYEDLQAGLKSEIAAGEIKITQLQGKLTVNLVDRILFDSGKAEIKDDGRKVLDKVGGILNTVADKNIRIEGHTDNKPITGELLAKYPSNWELSTARATAVARYLQDHDKVDPARLVAAGYGEFHPVAPNDTADSRALNRRIEIVLVPRD
ncbi:MAG: flagellar motor protein MotB [Elusimicrobiota bacterium]